MYTGLFTVNVGNFASARIIPFKRIVQAFPSVPATTTIQTIHRESQSAHDAEFASHNSHLESVGSKYTQSQNACVYQATAVTVRPVHFPSADPAGSSPNHVFSQRIIEPVIVPPDLSSFNAMSVLSARVQSLSCSVYVLFAVFVFVKNPENVFATLRSANIPAKNVLIPVLNVCVSVNPANV